MIITLDYKPVCSLFVLRPDVPDSCCHPCKSMGAPTARRNTTCSTFFQLRIHAGPFDLGTTLCDPLGKSLEHHCNEVPDHVRGTSNSTTTFPALSEDHSWEQREPAAQQTLRTAQHTRGAGAGSAVKTPVAFGTSLPGRDSHWPNNNSAIPEKWSWGGFRYQSTGTF